MRCAGMSDRSVEGWCVCSCNRGVGGGSACSCDRGVGGRRVSSAVLCEMSVGGQCVQCCVAGVWEDDVITAPSPAGGKDTNTASVRFSAAVFFLARCFRVCIYNNCFPDARICLYCDIIANL